MIRIETKTLKFWEQSYDKFDLAEIAFKYNISLKATRKAIFEGLAQSYVVESINEYFKKKQHLCKKLSK